MARYTYNESLVSQTIEDLSLSCKALDDTNSEMQKGINTVINARGVENIDVDFTFITNYQSQVIEYIETMSKEISSKAQEIEEYQSAPWYKKLFATIGLGALKIVEGLGSFVENLGDGVVSIFGFVGGVFSSDIQNACAEFVKKDRVGDFFYDQYEKGGLQWLNKYSIMSHQSTAANVLKGFGTAAGYVIVGVVTGGTGLAAMAPAAGVAFLGGIGSGTQSGLQQGMSFNDAFGKGFKEGVVAAGTTLVMDAAFSKLGSVAKSTRVADDLIEHGLKSADDLAAIGKTVDDLAKVGLNSADDFAKLGFKSVDDFAKLGFQSADDFAKVGINSADDLVKVGINSADDLAKAGIKSADDFAKVGINSADDLAKVGVKSADDFAKIGIDSADDLIKPKFGSKIAGKVDDIMTGLGKTKGVNIIAKAADAVGPRGVHAASMGIANGNSAVTNAVGANQYRIETNSEPSVGSNLVESATNTLNENISAVRNSAPSVSTYQPSSSSSGGYPVSNTGGGYSGGAGGSGNYSGNSVPAPEFESGTTIISTPPSSPSPTTPQPMPNAPTPNNPNPPTGGGNSGEVNPIGGGPTLPGGNYGGGRPVVNPGGGNYGNLAGESLNVSSDGIMNSLGNTTGSLNDIATSATNIPTSSSPIFSSDGLTQKSASVIPITAGLGAAGLAGIGTKAYLDKREKKEEEEEDSIETEEWQEDADSMNIEYGETENAEADYLTPTDEYAFQES